MRDPSTLRSAPLTARASRSRSSQGSSGLGPAPIGPRPPPAQVYFPSGRGTCGIPESATILQRPLPSRGRSASQPVPLRASRRYGAVPAAALRPHWILFLTFSQRLLPPCYCPAPSILVQLGTLPAPASREIPSSLLSPASS